MNRNIARACSVGALGCFLVALSVAAIAATLPSSPVTASRVLNDVRVQGAHDVVATLWANNDQWNDVMANIGMGTPEWLDVAVALHPGTDGGAAEMLDEAVFLALKPAPIAVLKLLKDQQFETAFVCSSNIGTDYTLDESRRFIGDRINVLTSLADSKLRATRDQCLKGLRAALREFDRSKKNGRVP
jgi:hypothetical protein